MRGRIRSLAWLAAAAALSVLAGPPAVSASPPTSSPGWAEDPIQVYYPRNDCRGRQIELELWDREAAAWRDHPVHPRVEVETCQVEDAGYLFNEIRWRCVEPPDTEPPPGWVVGLEVFDPAVMETCNPPEVAAEWGDLELHVESPAPGERVAEPEMEVSVEGSVRMDGVDGTDYDVLLLLDRSGGTQQGGGEPDLLGAQVEAARRFVESLAPRLGPVRIAVASYPNMPPLPDSPAGTAARREISFSDDAVALRAALDRLEGRRASGFQTFGSALDFALSELLGDAPGSRARGSARKVLVMAADAKGERPFGHGAAGDALFVGALRRRVELAQREHVSLHFFGMGGLAETLAPEVEEIFAVADADFRRVLRPALDTPFLDAVALPRVTGVVLENRTTGGGETRAEVSPSGRFASTLVAAAGPNKLWARATLSDGATTEREWVFEFDDRLVRERLLAAEREHMRRVRQKRLTLRPMWDEELPPVPEEIREETDAPDVAAEPPR